MGKILEIYLAKKDQPESSAYAALSFPAAAYQIQDAFDKLRLTEGEALYWEITEYYQFEELPAVLNDTCGLYDLNALAQKLSELDETQRAAFSGLLAMEQKTKRPLPITRRSYLNFSKPRTLALILSLPELVNFNCGKNAVISNVSLPTPKK